MSTELSGDDCDRPGTVIISEMEMEIENEKMEMKKSK